jgi:tRNA dimethylallyltransferase
MNRGISKSGSAPPFDVEGSMSNVQCSPPPASRLPTPGASGAFAWFLVGPTAVGKTAVAQAIAEQTGAAVLSADAMLVYRGMDVGTAKPSPGERNGVRYLGLDLVDPDQPFSVGAWIAQVRAQLDASTALPASAPVPGVLPGPRDLLVAGGTGLYVRALTTGLDAVASDPDRRRYWNRRLAEEGIEALRSELFRRAPDARGQLDDPHNPRRVIRALEHLDACGALPSGWRQAPRPRLVGLHLPRTALHARIAQRIDRMFASGFADEVADLRARHPSWTETARQAIGYAEVCDWVDGRRTLDQTKEQIAVRTRRLAKRQETWFRHQAEMTWIEIAPEETASAIAARVLTVWREHGPTPIRWG